MLSGTLRPKERDLEKTYFWEKNIRLMRFATNITNKKTITAVNPTSQGCKVVEPLVVSFTRPARINTKRFELPLQSNYSIRPSF